MLPIQRGEVQYAAMLVKPAASQFKMEKGKAVAILLVGSWGAWDLLPIGGYCSVSCIQKTGQLSV